VPGPLRKLIGTLVLKAARWDVAPLREQPPKSIMLGYPHTSNWDFVWLKASSWQYGIDVSFLGKRELFRGPLGWLLTALGGVPVDRQGSRGGMVDRMAEVFASRERLVLCIPPEGTREYVELWRSGFYHMALAAHVPLQLSLLDYGRRHIEVSDPLVLTGQVSFDMDRIRAFYRGAQGKFPRNTGAVRIKEEEAVGERSGP
jgi:1-acyl-sn-glycerol-3-phosphate acyltransferase